MSPRIVNWIYTAVVKPILLYGLALWWTALHKQCILTPLNKVQRMADLCVSGALRTTSKLEGQVGGGVYSEQFDIRKSFRLPDHCSVFQAEVHAIKEALTCLGNLNLQRGHLNIYSDSQAAIKSIYSTNTNSRTIADCRRSLHEMANQFTISLIWIPGHRDIVGNCIADELARQTTLTN